MNYIEIIKNYLKALEIGSYDHMMTLFAKGAIIHSPLYGDISAEKFYKEVFEDSSESKITLMNILKGEGNFYAGLIFYLEVSS